METWTHRRPRNQDNDCGGPTLGTHRRCAWSSAGGGPPRNAAEGRVTEKPIKKYESELRKSTTKLRKREGASKDALTQAAWNASIDKIVLETHDRALSTPINLRHGSHPELVPDTKHTAVWLIANEMVKKVKRLLFAQAKKAGAGDTGRTPVAKTWTKITREYAQSWMASQAPDDAWEAALLTMRKVCALTKIQIITTKQMAFVARAGAKVRKHLEDSEPWIAAKVATQAPEDVLKGTTREWMAWSINEERKWLGAKQPLTPAQADKALTTWRWKTAEPPLTMVALCHESNPFETENAWGHAIHAQHGRGKEQWRKRALALGTKTAGIEMRKKEVDRIKMIRTGIQKYVLRKISGPELGRMKKAWARNKVLEGDGEIHGPHLRDSEFGAIRWRIPISGPETLLLASAVDGLKPSMEMKQSEALLIEINEWLNGGEQDIHGYYWVKMKENDKTTIKALLHNEAIGKATHKVIGKTMDIQAR